MKTIELNSIQDISIDDLSKYNDIDYIIVIDPDDTCAKYTYQEFCKIKEIIEVIKKSIHGKNQKEIYSMATLLLSKLIYFDSKITNKDLEQIQSASSLKCLLTKRGACAGITDVMIKLMQEFGIECYHQRGSNDKIHVAHSWIKVNLDGKWYEDDISNNIANIRTGKFPSLFLKGLDKKGKREFSKGWIGKFIPYSYNDSPLSPSISDKEAIELLGKFGFKRRLESIINNKDLMKKDVTEIIESNNRVK